MCLLHWDILLYRAGINHYCSSERGSMPVVYSERGNLNKVFIKSGAVSIWHERQRRERACNYIQILIHYVFLVTTCHTCMGCRPVTRIMIRPLSSIRRELEHTGSAYKKQLHIYHFEYNSRSANVSARNN